MAAKLSLRNDSADCDQIWCQFRDHVAIHITQVVDGVQSALAQVRRADVPPFPYLGNGWTDSLKFKVW